MLTNIEKKLMLQINKTCATKTKALIPILQLEHLFVFDGRLNLVQMEEAFLSLFKHDLLDATFIKSKNGQFVFVKLKNKGLNFSNEQRRESINKRLIMLKTILFALLGVAIMLIISQYF